MPSSNPLPSKESTLFRKLLVSINLEQQLIQKTQSNDRFCKKKVTKMQIRSTLKISTTFNL